MEEGITVSEDDLVVFDVTVDDTPSDKESLEVCWDIDGTLDTDLDGTMNNDCDVSGTHFEYTWETSNSVPNRNGMGEGRRWCRPPLLP